LGDRDVQRILRDRIILVHGNPLDYSYGWDLGSFGRLYDVDKKIQILGEIRIPFLWRCFILKTFSVPSKCDGQNPDSRHFQGTLREMHQLSSDQSNNPSHPLNALSLPAN
jgi:hypothetical protein